MQEKLKKYSEFISEFTKNIDIFFESQKDFIKCAAGCAICCQTGYYPVTEVEYNFLKIGFDKLDKEKKDIIHQRVIQAYKERKIFTQEGNELFDFSYKCPFLFDDLCSLYEYRPIICRTHGLISLSVKNPKCFNTPTCMHIGLNYANIWDKEKKVFSIEKAQALNITATPEGFPVGYEAVIENLGDIEPGYMRMLFEWVIMDMPNYQEILDDINKSL